MMEDDLIAFELGKSKEMVILQRVEMNFLSNNRLIKKETSLEVFFKSKH
jgi:hypothetical protein